MSRFSLSLTGTLLLVLLLSSADSALGHGLRIGTGKIVYFPGETIVVWAVVRNDGSQATNLTVEVLMEDLGGRVAVAPTRQVIRLEAAEQVNLTLLKAPVDEAYYSGFFKVSVRLIEGRFVVDQEEIFLEVQGTPEDIDLRVRLCKDAECLEESLVFVKNERIYIGYVSSPEDISIIASLISPDGSVIDVSLPYNFTAKMTGPYGLTLAASKDGYRNLSLLRSFAVLDGEPAIAGTEKEPSELHLDIKKGEYAGSPSTIVEGSLTPIHAEANITIHYQKDDGTTVTTIVVTDDDSMFSDTFQPKATYMELLYSLLGRGTGWSVKASWEGDSNHLGTESDEHDFVLQYKMPLEILVLGGVVIVLLIGIAIALARRRNRN